MKKSYYYNGKTYVFTDVHVEAGSLFGICTTKPHYGKKAWLDPNGFKFLYERRVEATEIPRREDTLLALPGCHYWGGQVRNNAQWRSKW